MAQPYSKFWKKMYFSNPFLLAQTSVPFVNMSGYCKIYCRSNAFFFSYFPIEWFFMSPNVHTKIQARALCVVHPGGLLLQCSVCVILSRYHFFFHPSSLILFFFNPRIASRIALCFSNIRCCVRFLLCLPLALSSSPMQRAPPPPESKQPSQICNTHCTHIHTHTH